MAADASAQITELTVDDHACLTFGEREELFDLTAAFVRDGLAGGPEGDVAQRRRRPGQAVAELARRGIAVRVGDGGRADDRGGCEGRLLSGQAFRADAAVGWLTGQLESARERGFPGLRVAVDMSWALRPVTGIEQLPSVRGGHRRRP